MRKIYKKLTYILLTAVMLCLMIGSTAAADFWYDQSPVFYLEGTGKYATGTGVIGVYEGGSKPSIVRSSLKSSAPAVAALKYFHVTYSENEHETYGSKAAGMGTSEYGIGLTLKKAGTTKISFQAGKKKYTSTVKVLPYKNPLAVVKLSSVKTKGNTNLAGLLKNKNNATVKMSSTQKKAVLTLKAAAGWKIFSISYENPKRDISYSITEDSDSAALTLGYFPTGSNARIRISMVNKKTFGILECIYTIK